jgi:pseudouridine kinase
MVTRVTGAGDTFMAAHIAAEARGEAADVALASAVHAAADYVSAEVG